MGLHNLLTVAALTLLPALELRASIPWGILAAGEPWLMVLIVAVLANIALGPIIYFCLDKFVNIVTKVKFIEDIYRFLVKRTQKRAEQAIEKYGFLGITLFVAVPLPGSGSWTGALAAYLMGLGYKRFVLANTIGVIIAGILVTALTLLGTSAYAMVA